MFTQGWDSRLVLSLGFGLGLITVFISGLKPSRMNLGMILGDEMGLVSLI